MKLSLNWLKDFTQIPPGNTPDGLGEKLTLHTAEVEEVMDQKKGFDGVVIGKILKITPHPDADKLSVAKVDIGKKDPIQLIFGQMVDMKVGKRVPVAVAPTTLPTGMEILKKPLRGVKSEGMLCLDQELGLKAEGVDIQFFDNNVKPGTPFAEAAHLNDAVFDFDNKALTHRPDLWGHYGMAREVAALLRKPLKPYAPLTEHKIKQPSKKLDIQIKNTEISPRFSGCIIKNIRIKPSLEWMQQRLEAVGIRPINNIVDITNYLMLELGQPMHAYDRQIMGTDMFEVRYAKPGEILETIDHKKRKLAKEDPVVTNGKTPMGLAGIMGGATSEIHDKTTEIILEAANWDPVIVRKCSTRHGLRSDASQRFEKGMDPAMTDLAVNRALVLLLETCPDLVLETKVTTVGAWKPKTVKILADPEVINNKIGIKITTLEMIRILKSLEFDAKKQGKKIEVTIPSHRLTGDVDIEEDIVEEIARTYGYDQVPPEMPHLPINLPTENEERFHKHAARNILANILGFTEVINYSFYNEEMFTKCGLEGMRHFKVLNPLSSDQTHMRVSMVPGVLKAIEINQKNYSEIKLFEIGRTYLETGEYMPLEEKWLLAAHASTTDKEPFYAIKGAFESFQERFRAPSVSLRDCHTPPAYAHPKKCLEIMMRGESIGYIYALHPAVASAFGLDHHIAMFEANFTKLVAHDREPANFQALPKFPSMPFDVSILIDRKKTVNEVEKAIKKGDPNKLIQSVKLFDIYEGKNIPENKKSLAFSIELRHDERTLTEEEFQATQKAVFTEVEKLGGEVRK